jgi:hypothetical protein
VLSEVAAGGVIALAFALVRVLAPRSLREVVIEVERRAAVVVSAEEVTGMVSTSMALVVAAVGFGFPRRRTVVVGLMGGMVGAASTSMWSDDEVFRPSLELPGLLRRMTVGETTSAVWAAGLAQGLRFDVLGLGMLGIVGSTSMASVAVARGVEGEGSWGGRADGAGRRSVSPGEARVGWATGGEDVGDECASIEALLAILQETASSGLVERFREGGARVGVSATDSSSLALSKSTTMGRPHRLRGGGQSYSEPVRSMGVAFSASRSAWSSASCCSRRCRWAAALFTSVKS